MIAWHAMLRGVLLCLCLALSAAPSRGFAQAREGATGLGRPTPSQPAAPAPLPAPATTATPLPSPADAAMTVPFAGTTPGSYGATDGDVIARLESIDGHMQSLAARRGSSIGSGVVNLLMGGTYIGIGAYAAHHGGGQIAGYFYLTGGATVLSAGVYFGLQPNPRRAYDHLQQLRVDPMLDPRAQLVRAERLFGSMARRRMASRYVQGTLSLGITVGSLPILFGHGGFDASNGFDWLIAASAGIGLVDALTTMFQRTEEERRWRMYQRFADNHGGEAVLVPEAPRLRYQGVSAVGSPAGGFGVARFAF